MPEQEFEIYLSLLSKLLKLSPTQKAAISDELRCHLEEQLEALVQTGLPRDQAIRKAMEEFGDVSGLAIDLTRASRTPLRTVAVRSTIAVSVVAALVVGWLTLFVPEHRMAAPLAVQAEPRANPVAERTDVKVDSNPLRDMLHDAELFPEFLTKKTDVVWKDRSLVDALRELESMHQIPIEIDRTTFVGGTFASENRLINLNLQGLTFEEVLNLLTRQCGLMWQTDGRQVQLTASDSARQLTRQFDVHSLVKSGHNPANLILLLRNMVGGEWFPDDEDGGSIVPIGRSLIIRNRFQRMRRVAQLLAFIESPGTEPQSFDVCSTRERLIVQLGESSSLNLENVSLRKALDALSKQHAIPIVVDWKTLGDLEITIDRPVTLKVVNKPLGKVLDELLQPVALAYAVRDGVIEVTGKSDAEEYKQLVAYNVRDLLKSGVTFGQLLSAIRQTIRTGWFPDDEDGGRLQPEAGGILFVKQTAKIQHEVKTLIDQLQQTQGRHQAEAAQAESPPPERVVLRVYRLNEGVATDLVSTIPRLVAPASWGDQCTDHSNPQIANIGSQLIIRQTTAVHRQVDRFLVSIGVPVHARIEIPMNEDEDRSNTDFGGLFGGGGMGGGMSGGMGGGGMGMF